MRQNVYFGQTRRMYSAVGGQWTRVGLSVWFWGWYWLIQWWVGGLARETWPWELSGIILFWEVHVILVPLKASNKNNLKLLLGLRSLCLWHDDPLTYHFQSRCLQNQRLAVGYSLFSAEGGLTAGCSVRSHTWRNARPQSQTSPLHFSFLGKLSLKTQRWNIDM